MKENMKSGISKALDVITEQRHYIESLELEFRRVSRERDEYKAMFLRAAEPIIRAKMMQSPPPMNVTGDIRPDFVPIKSIGEVGD